MHFQRATVESGNIQVQVMLQIEEHRSVAAAGHLEEMPELPFPIGPRPQQIQVNAVAGLLTGIGADFHSSQQGRRIEEIADGFEHQGTGQSAEEAANDCQAGQFRRLRLAAGTNPFIAQNCRAADQLANDFVAQRQAGITTDLVIGNRKVDDFVHASAIGGASFQGDVQGIANQVALANLGDHEGGVVIFAEYIVVEGIEFFTEG